MEPGLSSPPNSHRGQRLSDRLSAAKVNGRACEEQALKAFGQVACPVLPGLLFIQRYLIQHVLALAGNLRGKRGGALERHFLEQ